MSTTILVRNIWYGTAVRRSNRTELNRVGTLSSESDQISPGEESEVDINTSSCTSTTAELGRNNLYSSVNISRNVEITTGIEGSQQCGNVMSSEESSESDSARLLAGLRSDIHIEWRFDKKCTVELVQGSTRKS